MHYRHGYIFEDEGIHSRRWQAPSWPTYYTVPRPLKLPLDRSIVLSSPWVPQSERVVQSDGDASAVQKGENAVLSYV